MRITSRLSKCAIVAGALALTSYVAAKKQDLTEVDTLILGGTVYDGSGEASRSVEIAINDGQILFIGPGAEKQFEARYIIDATSKIVAPGFIDPHTHAGSDLASDSMTRRSNSPYIFQGVTTVVIGNDGGGKPDIAAMAERSRTQGIGTNVAYLAGFGPIREAVLAKENRPPNPSELAEMEAIIRGAMCEGAFGFSTGLYYAPQAFSKTDVVVALATVTAEHGGYYDTHLRDESTYNITVTGAVTEALEIGREAKIAVHIAHIKALGPAVWGHSAKMIELIEQARANGQRVTADQYPWLASGTRFSNALVPRWALEGGLKGLRARLADETLHATIRQEMINAIARRGGADKLLVTGLLGVADIPAGKNLAELAVLQDREPVDAALATLAVGDARIASFNMSADDIAAFAARDWVVTGSDGSKGHPRKFGSFPKAYRDLVLDGKISLERFIRRSSGQTADIIGLNDRGYLRVGYAADIVIFDEDTYAPQATYQAPRELSVGVEYLLVNGVPVISNGEYSGALPGQPLLKNRRCGPSETKQQR